MNEFSSLERQQSQSNKVKVVAGYALQQKLGSGSFALVYKGVRVNNDPSSAFPNNADDTNTNNANQADTVAIKVIQRNSQKLTKKVLQNLEIEISILRTYRHRNIVCLHDVQKTERHFYLILEYCAGGDLQRLIRTRRAGRLSERLTRRLMRDLAEGCKFLWGQELIHRDIKPQNLLLTGPLPLDEVNDPERTPELEAKRQEANFASSQFTLKIADFGFARHLQSASLAETLCGSPLYMAPEILQHQRYDAKADLWSVGTVMFEMISGKPPFHGENHIDLLRNIQRKAVRLPPDVRVSKECVNLLRLLLNRNPLSRAGFKEFFEACNAFVALGCFGETPVVDAGTCHRPTLDLGTIPENDNEAAPGTESLLTVATAAPPGPQISAKSPPNQVTPPLGPVPAPSIPTLNAPSSAVTRSGHPMLTPLAPSPPPSSQGNYYAIPGGPTVPTIGTQPQSTETMPQAGRRSDLAQSGEEGSFVMVEYGSIQKSPSVSAVIPSNPQPRVEQSPPSSPHYYSSLNRGPVLSSRGDYMVVKQPPKGMLSTSPGTGGALMGMAGGRARLPIEGSPGQVSKSPRSLEPQIKLASKMLAASEDVGRRAISVAHLGDKRAYAAIRLIAMNESNVLSGTPMDGIVEESAANDTGAVTDDDRSSSDLMEGLTIRRRRSSSATDKSMPDATRVEDSVGEMPFAVSSEPPPVVDTVMPSRESASFSKGTSIASAKAPVKPTPAVIRAHFSEALSCYLMALKMLKGAVGAAERVKSELATLTTKSLSTDQRSHVQKLQRRCEVTADWLGEQFRGVLERGDAANAEMSKLPSSQSPNERNDSIPVTSVEELIYNNALALGREGAVKQLLGQFDAARASYRSAGLLAETLLMESSLSPQDRSVLEGYVDGFAARITELDEVMLQQSQHSRLATSSASVASMRRGPGVVGLVGSPSALAPSQNLGPPPMR